MKIISCSDCGVVLDTDRIVEPSTHRHDEQTVIENQAAWNGEEYEATIDCPCCKTRIFYTTGDAI